jgi:flavin-dependent thymidylate synthase
MYSIDDIKVELINAEEVKNFIKNHGIFACQCYMTPEKFAERVGMSCLVEGHTSGSRADMFKFRIHCPRYCADQIMRHGVGTAINCQSQRYVDMDDNFSIYVPPQVLADPMQAAMYEAYENKCKDFYVQIRDLMNEQEITGEQANDLMRTMLPIGVPCNLTMGFTIEALIHFMHKRLCVRADAPIRRVAKLMKEAVLAVEPRYAELFVPQCQADMYCPEKHGCGAYPSKEEVQRLIELGKQCCKNKQELLTPLDVFEIDLGKLNK